MARDLLSLRSTCKSAPAPLKKEPVQLRSLPPDSSPHWKSTALGNGLAPQRFPAVLRRNGSSKRRALQLRSPQLPVLQLPVPNQRTSPPAFAPSPAQESLALQLPAVFAGAASAAWPRLRPEPDPTPLSAPVHCRPAGGAARPRPQSPRAAPARQLQARWERVLRSWLLLIPRSRVPFQSCGACGWRSSLLRLGDAVGQPLQLGAVQDFGVHHAHQQRLNRPLAKPVHDAFDGAAGNALTSLRGPIKKCAVFNGVSQIALLLQPPQYGANRGVLERTPQFFADLLGRHVTHAPHNQQNASFQLAQLRRIMIESSVTRHSVTDCST